MCIDVCLLKYWEEMKWFVYWLLMIMIFCVLVWNIFCRRVVILLLLVRLVMVIRCWFRCVWDIGMLLCLICWCWVKVVLSWLNRLRVNFLSCWFLFLVCIRKIFMLCVFWRWVFLVICVRIVLKFFLFKLFVRLLVVVCLLIRWWLKNLLLRCWLVW